MNKTWPKVKLGEVLKPTNRQTALNSSQAYKLLGVRLDGGGPFLREQKLGSQLSANTLYQVKNGDFIYSRLFAWRGAFGVICNTLDSCFVSNEFPTFTAQKEQLNANFLKYWFRLPHILKQVEADCTGSTPLTRNRYKENFFLNLQIPLPPLAEQQRIVEKIERLARKIEEAKELRQRTIQTAETLADTYTNIFFRKIPDHTLIDTIAEVRGGIQKSPNRLPGKNPVRYLTVAHVHRNRILVNDPRYFEVTLEELDRWRLLPGDVLIIEGNGSADQIGRTALFNGEIKDCVHQNHVIRIRPNQQHIIPEFINIFFNSPIGKDTVQAQSRTSSGLRTLSVGRIKNISIPIPSIATQHQIIAKLNILQSQVSTLKAIQGQTTAELDALLPSILDKAFKGEL